MNLSLLPERYKKKYNNKDEPYIFSIFDTNKSDEILEYILELPHSSFIEKSNNENYEIPYFLSDKDNNLYLSITTSTGYNSNIAHLFTSSITNRFQLNEQQITNIKTCLHEAIINAVMHGNLELKDNFQTIEELYERQSKIDNLMTMDEYKLRRINIHAYRESNNIQITVSDEGRGFNISTYRRKHLSPNGRGLMLIHSLADSVWLGSNRRTLFMRFTS